jgi:hypothetical protein
MAGIGSVDYADLIPEGEATQPSGLTGCPERDTFRHALEKSQID